VGPLLKTSLAGPVGWAGPGAGAGAPVVG